MGRRNLGQGQLFYEFRLDEAIPEDHLVRKIRALLDLSWVYAELSHCYSEIGRPSIDPCREFKSISPVDGSVSWA